MFYFLYFCTESSRWAFVRAATGCCCPRRAARIGGSSITLGTKGMKRFLDPHRRRMPWTASKECVPDVVPYNKENMVLGSVQRVDLDCVDRASQVDLLEA
ncbi:hypothetical protein TcCL_Unassigned01152 [Trypanosoma cruzi]|nr:hypothetical protein TcCL_Unassigned01152 [Trypanosoma cruzi]